MKTVELKETDIELLQDIIAREITIAEENAFQEYKRGNKGRAETIEKFIEHIKKNFKKTRIKEEIEMRNLDENRALLILDARREEYSKTEASKGTMTIRQLIDMLEEYAEDYGEDTKVITSHDRGYTYGGVREGLFEAWIPEDEEEDE